MASYFDYDGYDQRNWGGYDEDPISAETMRLANGIYDLLNRQRPDDAPGGDGSIAFEWRNGDDMLCLDIHGDAFRVYGTIGGKFYRSAVKQDPDATFEAAPVTNGERK